MQERKSVVLPQPMPIWVDAQASDMPKTASAKLQVIRVSTDMSKKNLNITLNGMNDPYEVRRKGKGKCLWKCRGEQPLYQDEPRLFLISFWKSPLELEQMDENCSCQADKRAHQMLMIVREK